MTLRNQESVLKLADGAGDLSQTKENSIGDPIVTVLELHALIATEREEAYTICAEKGEGDPACRVAWDIVEELLAARADRQEVPVTAFGQFCLDHPEALECRVYDL